MPELEFAVDTWPDVKREGRTLPGEGTRMISGNMTSRSCAVGAMKCKTGSTRTSTPLPSKVAHSYHPVVLSEPE